MAAHFDISSQQRTVLDNEYQKFRQQGDSLFAIGQYEKALNKYLSCLDVPGFENDAYAQEKTTVCDKAKNLKSNITQWIQQAQIDKALEAIRELLVLNPNDMAMKEMAFRYWTKKGEEAMNQKQWPLAYEHFGKALGFRSDKNVYQKRAQCEKQIVAMGYSPPSRIALKIGLGAVAVGAGVYTMVLNKGWNDKLNTLNSGQQSGDVAVYQKAYDEAAQYHSKQALRNVCIGIAVAAVVADVYLLLHKPKPSRLSLNPANTGLAILYKF